MEVSLSVLNHPTPKIVNGSFELVHPDSGSHNRALLDTWPMTGLGRIQVALRRPSAFRAISCGTSHRKAQTAAPRVWGRKSWNHTTASHPQKIESFLNILWRQKPLRGECFSKTCLPLSTDRECSRTHLSPEFRNRYMETVSPTIKQPSSRR